MKPLKTLLIACLLSTLGASSAGGQVVINEFFCGTPDWIELRNLSGVPVDLGGWSLSTYQASSGNPVLEGTFVLPPSTIIQSGGFLVLQEYGAAGLPGTLPCSLSIGFNLNWTSTRSVAVVLRNAQQVAVDYVYRQGPGGASGAPHLPSGQTWVGSYATTGNGCARAHDVDSDLASDWSGAVETVCAANPGQSAMQPVSFGLSTNGLGDATLSVATTPARPGAEFAMLISSTDLVPNGSGPVFGLAWDALASLQPAQAGSPFHSWLDAQGGFAFSAPPGTVPSGLHIEAVVIVVVLGQLTVSSVVDVTF